jgi:predicted DNA-binding transcriptional regulator AlpA
MVDAIPFRDRLLVGWDDITQHTGLSRRLLEREVSAGRMPAPDVRVGRRACWRAATIMQWIDELADRQGRRSRP